MDHPDESVERPRGHSATRLTNGKVLIAGGKNVTTSSSTVLATAQLFDPSSGSGTWSSAGTMTAPRQQHSATLLSPTIVANGQVLVAGGSNSTTATLSSAELFNGTSTWTATSNLLAATKAQTASLLSNGLVLIAGGVNGTTTVPAAEVYDPSRGLPCTTNTQCTTGFCVGGVCCNSACTDQCFSCTQTGSIGTCSPKANGAACNDSNACTQTDTCQNGTCTGSNPIVCAPPDQCHLSATCDPATGTCVYPNQSNGTTCNDGNACTQTDTCENGACSGANPVVCMALDQCHDAGTCNTSTGACTNPIKPNGTSCNDGNVCAQDRSCQNGICTSSNPAVCPITGYCPSNATSCCPAGFTAVVLSSADDTFQTAQQSQCIVGLEGRDTIAAQGGHSIVIGGPNDDTIQAANGNNYVVPGGGVDTVATGTGDDTVAIYDMCELVSGDTVDLGTGNNTLIAPLGLSDLQARGLNIANVQNILIQQNSCRSECSIKPDCSGHGQCQEGSTAGQMTCLCDSGFIGSDCGVPDSGAGTVGQGGRCASDSQCVTGLVCGPNNGGHFDLPSYKSVCWPPGCVTDPIQTGCDFSGAPCGRCNGIAPPCGDNNTCVSGNTCGQSNGSCFGLTSLDKRCWPSVCETDPASTGSHTVGDPCGLCSCIPQCAGKQCGDDPSDGCGGLCPGICNEGDSGCTHNIECPITARCIDNQCKPISTVFTLDCGDTCPHPSPDPCSQCQGNQFCNDQHQCVDIANDHPALPPSVTPLGDSPTSGVGALEGYFGISEGGRATYSVPIVGPPASGSVEPSIALVYGSNGRNGTAGTGWTISGFSTISRCPRIAGTTAIAAPIHFDETDEFCLDGLRLMLQSGVYGDDGAEYRTELDDFAQIVSHGAAHNSEGIYIGPSSFEVRAKDGRVFSYGADEPSSVFVNSKGLKRIWAVNRVVDRGGNLMTIAYQSLGNREILGPRLPIETNEIVPSGVFYGGTLAAGSIIPQ